MTVSSRSRRSVCSGLPLFLLPVIFCAGCKPPEEAGVKAIIGERLRVNAAFFDIDTRDELAIASNAGGRSTFKNVGRTSRNGFELGASASQSVEPPAPPVSVTVTAAPGAAVVVLTVKVGEGAVLLCTVMVGLVAARV